MKTFCCVLFEMTVHDWRKTTYPLSPIIYKSNNSSILNPRHKEPPRMRTFQSSSVSVAGTARRASRLTRRRSIRERVSIRHVVRSALASPRGTSSSLAPFSHSSLNRGGGFLANACRSIVRRSTRSLAREGYGVRDTASDGEGFSVSFSRSSSSPRDASVAVHPGKNE